MFLALLVVVFVVGLGFGCFATVIYMKDELDEIKDQHKQWQKQKDEYKGLVDKLITLNPQI